MKVIDRERIIEEVAQMCMEAAYRLPDEVISAYTYAALKETSPLAREVLDDIISNAAIGGCERIPVCQDTGMAVFFIELGNEAYIQGGGLTDIINEGVRKGYAEGYLRKSIVADPISRRNTGDNTPAVIHYDLVQGDGLKIRFMPKGFGSENMSAVRMLKPSDGEDGVAGFVLETVKNAGPNPCPPLFIGVGLGGTMEKAAILSKKALMRKPGQRHEDPYYAGLESRLIEEINMLGIGPGGYGGRTTAFDLFIEAFPTHIAGLPAAVTICCHSLRHSERVL